jgi:hypothetical protein
VVEADGLGSGFKHCCLISHTAAFVLVCYACAPRLDRAEAGRACHSVVSSACSGIAPSIAAEAQYFEARCFEAKR